MAEKDKTTLKALFETGDSATEANFTDLIDSAMNLADTGIQTVAGPVGFSNAISVTDVSGPAVSTSAATHAVVSASAAAFDNLTVGGGSIFAGGGGTAGTLTIAATAETAIAVAGTFVAVSGGFTPGAVLVQCSAESVTGVLKYTGAATENLYIKANISTQAAGNSKLTSWRIGQDGATIAASEIDRFVGTGADTGAISVGMIVSANTSAEFQIFCANKTDTVNIEVHKLVMIMHQV